MDDEATAPEPAPWLTPFKDASAGLRSWVERWNDPRARRAVADDGLLDTVVIGGSGWGRRAGVFLRALLRRPSLGPDVRFERARCVRLESTPPLPVQVEGDIIGSLPTTFSAAPGALWLIVPRGRQRRLICASSGA
jgi:diacylglycerol kinase family enzyme